MADRSEAELAARSAPDGSTLLIGSNGTPVIKVGLYRKLLYDPLRDFAPATQIVPVGTALVANAPSEFALLSGEVEVAQLSIPVVIPHVRAGRTKALGIATAKRSRRLPEVPMLQEQGLGGYEFGIWHGLLASKGTPESIVRRLYREVARIVGSKEVRDLVAARGNEMIASTPEEFAARLGRDLPRYRRIMADAGIEPQ